MFIWQWLQKSRGSLNLKSYSTTSCNMTVTPHEENAVKLET